VGGLVSGLVGGLVSGLVGGLAVGLVAGLFWLVVGLVIGLFWLVVGLVIGLFGLGAGLVYGLVAGLFGLVAGLFWLLVGLVIGLGGMLGSDREISCVETVRWSWSAIRDSGRVILTVGLVIGLGVGLVIGLGGGLVVGLVYGLVGVLVVGLLQGLSLGEIETRALPNEGIHRSARNALVVGLVVGLGFGLVVGLGFGLGFGLVVGQVVGLVVGLHAGGQACLKHVVLRLWLIRNGSTPWHYVRFLDYAADRLLLRKVGGGYAFIHRMLLEYFAARYELERFYFRRAMMSSRRGSDLGADSGPLAGVRKKGRRGFWRK
jgi:hypothetical protein